MDNKLTADQGAKPRFLGEAPDDYPFWQAKDGTWLTAKEIRRMSRDDRYEWKREQGYICGAQLGPGGWATDAAYCELEPNHKGKHEGALGEWPDGFRTVHWGSIT